MRDVAGESLAHEGAIGYDDQAGGALVTAQRIGAAIGIAVVGTALFGSGSGQGSGSKPNPVFLHTAQLATAANLGSSSPRCCARWPCRPPSAPSAPPRTSDARTS